MGPLRDRQIQSAYAVSPGMSSTLVSICGLEIIRRYEDRLSFWESEQDRGRAGAINKAMRRIWGEIVAWLNSDDTDLPGAVAHRFANAVQAPLNRYPG